MKLCPSCGYRNSGAGVKCAVCGRDISALPEEAEPRPGRAGRRMLVSGLLLLGVAAAFFLAQRPTAPPARPAPGAAVSRGEDFNYNGVLYSLDKMGGLEFLSREDKLRVIPLLDSRDDRVARAAARLGGSWLRSNEDAAAAGIWFGALLRAASAGGGAVRRQAALELGRAGALGFPFSASLGEIRRGAGGLPTSGDEGLVSAGFLLASVVGIEDLNRLMLKTLKDGPSPGARLYAACSLAGLNRVEGYRYLATLAEGGDKELQEEVLDCLAYSAMPETRSFLDRMAGSGDPDLAARAKRAVKFREQLAIIKK